jgi:hypothetical protein
MDLALRPSRRSLDGNGSMDGVCTIGGYHKLPRSVGNPVVQLSWHRALVTVHILVERLDGVEQCNSMDANRVILAGHHPVHFQVEA